MSEFPVRHSGIRRVTQLLAVLAVLLVGCSKPKPRGLETITFSGETMGTTYTVKAVFSDAIAPVMAESLPETVQKRLDKIDKKTFSTYQKKSELSRLNATRANKLFQITPEFKHVLKMALEIADITKGAFDPTVAPLVDLWGFGPDEVERIPTDQEIADALELVGYRAIHHNDMLVTKKRPLWIDLSAIAKGYAVDKVAAILRSSEAKGYMVEIGGEVRTSGKRDDDTPWKIAIEEPEPGNRSVRHVLEVESASIATSGDYRNFRTEGDTTYSHTIDPRTGRPITHNLASVTVVHVNAAAADAWATAMMVMGAEDSLKLAEEYYMPILVITRTEDGYKDQASSKFRERFPDVLGAD